MTCPGCGASMRLEDGAVTWVCPHCRAQHSPLQDPGQLALLEPADHNCPVCQTRLHHATLAGARLKACPRCRGVLLDMDLFPGIAERLRLLAHLRDAAPVRAAEAELERRIRCPRCRQLMDTHYYGGPGAIVIDSCSACALNWLDAGELLRVAVASPDLESPLCPPSEF